jgi:hypothetical protein
VLRRLFGHKREEIKGGWRKIQREEFHGSYPVTIVVRVTEYKRMESMGHVSGRGEVKTVGRTSA